MENITSNETKFLPILFRNPAEAENAYNELLNKGYKKEDITLIMSDDTHKNHFTYEESVENNLPGKTLEGMSVGGAVGGTIGAVAAAIAAAGTTLVIPGLGIAIAGSLAAAFAGAGAGAATGGLVGALIGAGVPDEEAAKYEQDIKEGGIVIGVTPSTFQEYEELTNKWSRHQ
ncbi:MAG: hypothetical protein BGO76_00155 [Caedibacter sp. 38-128]|nr:MAG: hypothetical protein BGO76_00155 [Caedibacter sp. 38-128]